MYKNVKNFVLELLRPFKGASASIILLIGVVFIVLGEYRIDQIPESLSVVLSKVGGTILGAGVFVVILKSAQFTEIFKKHISDVIYNPANLKDPVLFVEKWKVFTEAILSEVLPLSFNKAGEAIRKQYFDDELEYHFEDFDLQYEIEVVYGSSVKVKNTFKANLIISPNVSNPKFIQKIKSDKTAQLSSLYINGDKIDTGEKNFKDDGNGQKVLTLELNKYAKGQSSVKFSRTFVIEQDIKTEPFISVVLSRYVKGATVRAKIKNPSNKGSHNIRFVGMGIEMAAQPRVDDGGFNRWVLAQSEDLLLPGQGFILIIVPNPLS